MDTATIRPEPVEDLFDREPEPSLVDDYTEPDPEFLKKGRRKPYAAAYEKKVKGALNTLMRIFISNPTTVPDAATVIMYGPQFSEAMGDWAAEDQRVRKAIDFIAGGADNPALLAISTLGTIALQMLRNHEPVAETPVRMFRIPFTKRAFKLRFRIRLGKLRNMTNDPQQFTNWVFSNEGVRNALKEQGITLGGEQPE